LTLAGVCFQSSVSIAFVASSCFSSMFLLYHIADPSERLQIIGHLLVVSC
jgi:hypothetical protein